MTRWFAKVDPDGTPYVLFRMDKDDEAKTMDTLLWDDVDESWVDYPRLALYIIDGDPRLEEITEEQAREFSPEALEAGLTKAVADFEVSKSVVEERFTLGPMYIPDVLDAHAEWTDADELQKAVWKYVKSGDRRIRLQHNRDKVAGEWVEVMTWPYEVEVPMMRKAIGGDDVSEPTRFPAGTVFLGVKWEPWAWQMVKEGNIRGYSIGGRAERLYVDLEKSADLSIIDESPEYIEPDPQTPVESSGDLVGAIGKAIAEAMKQATPVVNVVMPESKPTTRVVERDDDGNIIRIIEE